MKPAGRLGRGGISRALRQARQAPPIGSRASPPAPTGRQAAGTTVRAHGLHRQAGGFPAELVLGLQAILDRTRNPRPTRRDDHARGGSTPARERGRQCAARGRELAPDAPPGVKDALTSLTYNAGSGWQQAGLGRLIREGRYDEARERFAQYNKAGGSTLPGLVSRRNAELSSFWDRPAATNKKHAQCWLPWRPPEAPVRQFPAWAVLVRRGCSRRFHRCRGPPIGSRAGYRQRPRSR